MTKTTTNPCFALCLLAAGVIGLSQFAARADGQECTSPVELRKHEIIQKLGGGVRLHRREDLEDDLMQVSPKDPTRLVPPVLVYEVQDTRFTVFKDEVLIQVCNDGCSRQQYVGISSDGGHAYWLFGFEHPEAAFEAMAADANVRIGNSTSADAFGSACAELVGGVKPARWVLSTASAQSIVADFFLSKDARGGLKRAMLWWDRYPKDTRPDLEMHVTGSQENGFRLTIPIFEPRGAGPTIVSLRVDLSTRGACTISTH